MKQQQPISMNTPSGFHAKVGKQLCLIMLFCFCSCNKQGQSGSPQEIELSKQDQLTVLWSNGSVFLKKDGNTIVSVGFSNSNINGKQGRTVTTFDDFQRGDGIAYKNGGMGALSSYRRVKINGDDFHLLYSSDGKIEEIFNLSKKEKVSIDAFQE